MSPDFLASDFIHKHELGPLLKKAEQGGVQILWVPVRDSSYKKTALKDYQAVLDPTQPLAKMKEADRDSAWVTICEEIEKAVNSGAGKPLIEVQPSRPSIEKVSDFLKSTVPEKAPHVEAGRPSSTMAGSVFKPEDQIQNAEVLWREAVEIMNRSV